MIMTNHVPPSAMPLISPPALLRAYLNQQPPRRPSSRTPVQSRPIELNTSSLSHCHGSSLVRIGATSVVCGVRAEILPVSEIPSFRVNKTSTSTTAQQTHDGGGDDEDDADADLRNEDELAHYNLLVPNLTLDTGCSPLHPANTAPSIEAQSIAQRLLSLLLTSRLIRLSDLEIWHTPTDDDTTTLLSEQQSTPTLRAYWVLYIDVLCISHAGTGSVFDASWLAIYAALKDVLLPNANWDVDEACVYCSPNINEAKKLRLRGMPVPLSFGVFEDTLLIDLDPMEEECVLEKGCVVVDKEGDVLLRMEKWGGGEMKLDTMLPQLLDAAQERWKEWRKVLTR